MEPPESTSTPVSYNPKNSVVSFLEPIHPLRNSQRDESPHSLRARGPTRPNALLSVVPFSERRQGETPLPSPLSRRSASPTVADYPSDCETRQESRPAKGKNSAGSTKSFTYTPYNKADHGGGEGLRKSRYELGMLDADPNEERRTSRDSEHLLQAASVLERTAYRNLFKAEFLRWQAETKQYDFSMEPSVPDALSDKARELGIPMSDLPFPRMPSGPGMQISTATSATEGTLPISPSVISHFDNSSRQSLTPCPDYMSVRSAPSLRSGGTIASGQTLLRKRRQSVTEMREPEAAPKKRCNMLEPILSSLHRKMRPKTIFPSLLSFFSERSRT
ncbi:hypothetical protein BU17DRAFT_92968 [Hysterangium stoloniferum]|nr:hypothetical protein BU17DRAFT_92968 [Hysterangium stoloniferum]